MAKEEKETKKPKKRISKKVEQKEVKEEKEVKKTKKTYSSRDAIIIMILSIIIGVLIGSVVTRYLSDKKHSKGLKEYDEVYQEVKENHYKPISKNDVLFSSLNGLVDALGDRYAEIVDSKNAIVDYEENLSGEFTGIGIRICGCDGRIKIVSVFEDSPAEKSGIQANDIILKMDGIDYDLNNYDDFSYNISAYGKGKKVELELLRDTEIVTKEVELDVVKVPSVIYYQRELNDKKIGIFDISDFADNTYDQFYDKYNEVKGSIDGIILDIRYNSEGRLENASKIASLFLEKGSVIYQYYNNGEYEEVISNDKKVINLPVIVVVSEGTVAGGELIASTLNENLGVQIVGNKTFGKGLIQNAIPLTNGRMMLYSAKEWVTSKKNKVEEVGINPTVETICDEGICETDLAIDKAFEIITSSLM